MWLSMHPQTFIGKNGATAWKMTWNVKKKIEGVLLLAKI